MPAITDLQFQARQIRPDHRIPELDRVAVSVEVRFDTYVLDREPGGPWQGDVRLVGVDGDVDQFLTVLALFQLPIFQASGAFPGIDVRKWKFSADLPARVVDEDPGIDNVFIDDVAWVPGLGPWINPDASMTRPDGYPHPEGGPEGAPPLRPGVGYLRVLAHGVPAKDELVAIVSVGDGRGSQASARSSVEVIAV